MDGDSRGGAALSVREVSGRPIKFVGSGEKLEALELFYPDRIASRILGMGTNCLDTSDMSVLRRTQCPQGLLSCRGCTTAGCACSAPACIDGGSTVWVRLDVAAEDFPPIFRRTHHGIDSVAGDILSLVEKAEQSIKGADAERMAERMLANKFDFNDFMDQSRMMGQMGSMGQMMKMIPGAQHFCVVFCVASLVWSIVFCSSLSTAGDIAMNSICRVRGVVGLLKFLRAVWFRHVEDLGQADGAG